MPAPAPIPPDAREPSAAREGSTERVPALTPVDERARRQDTPQPGPVAIPSEPGHYLQVQAPGEARLVRLEDGVTHIGRGLSADLRLDENSVSRRHAMLIREDCAARILDDRSSNGTFVNDRRIEQAELSSGDVIKIGRVKLLFLEVQGPG
jgi:pSer/pThr/pTyr-binding forkhead associated (FHA) protein